MKTSTYFPLFLTLISSVSGFNIITPRNVGAQTVSSLFSSVPETPSPASTESSAPAPAVPAPAIPAAAAVPAVAADPAAAAVPAAAPDVNNQPKYGKELELPGTYVRCGRCATSYAIGAGDLGTGKGRRVECALCGHSWFQTPDRLFTLNDGHELIPLPKTDVTRINSNMEAGRDPDFMGNAKFYVGNLDFGVQESDLSKLFAEIGPVGGVSIVSGPDGRSRGFAFVTMMEDDDATMKKCIGLDGHDLKGRNINVKPPNN